MSDSPFEALVGCELDCVSFVRDYVELRIDYSIIRLLIDPRGSVDGEEWNLADGRGADGLRKYIGRTVVAADFVDGERLVLHFDGAIIHASLRDADRVGPEALHFMPADARGQVHAEKMWIW